MIGVDGTSNAVSPFQTNGRTGQGGIAPTAFFGFGLTGGHYTASPISGLMASGGGGIAAPAEFLSIRWQDTKTYMIPLRISLQFICTAFAGGVALSIAAWRATSFSANASGTGSTTVTNPTKMQTSGMSPSLFQSQGDFRIAGTTNLTGGAKTLDGNAFAAGAARFTAAQDTPFLDLYSVPNGKYPIVLGNNEGIVLRFETINIPASNTFLILPTIEWIETPGVPF